MKPEELQELVELLTAKVVARRLRGVGSWDRTLWLADSLRLVLTGEAMITASSVEVSAGGNTRNIEISLHNTNPHVR